MLRLPLLWAAASSCACGSAFQSNNSFTISFCPLTVATVRLVSRPFAAQFTLALACSSLDATAKCPPAAARCRLVQPMWFVRSTSAFDCSSSHTASSRLSADASMRGVSSYTLFALMFALKWRRVLIQEVWPCFAANMRGVKPTLFLTSTSKPWSWQQRIMSVASPFCARAWISSPFGVAPLSFHRTFAKSKWPALSAFVKAVSWLLPRGRG
mmetsp:Transcript_58564/g.136829  ORF Transcript_58564/g.136829 Transcript_58564/m.136829 type:complete len:212 (+) Transcript_58564:138-773(+)